MKNINTYTIKNKNGMTAELTNYGTKITRLLVIDKYGKFDDMSGFDTLQENIIKNLFWSNLWTFRQSYQNGQFADGIKYTQLKIMGNALRRCRL